MRVVLLILVAWSGVLACAEKVSRASFEAVEEGMTLEEVEDLLGEPTDAKSVGVGAISGTHATWNASDGATISIQFLNGKVVSKQFLQRSGGDGSD